LSYKKTDKPRSYPVFEDQQLTSEACGYHFRNQHVRFINNTDQFNFSTMKQ